jgi:hypothetical protein
MDSDDIAVMAGSFLSFLADGCGVSANEMQAVFDVERSGTSQIVAFLSENFDPYRLLSEERTHSLTARYGHFVERKVECA